MLITIGYRLVCSGWQAHGPVVGGGPEERLLQLPRTHSISASHLKLSMVVLFDRMCTALRVCSSRTRRPCGTAASGSCSALSRPRSTSPPPRLVSELCAMRASALRLVLCRCVAGRRIRVCSLLCPAACPGGLTSHVCCRVCAEAYPFSVKPDRPISLEDMFRFNRDNFDGSEFDLYKVIPNSTLLMLLASLR